MIDLRTVDPLDDPGLTQAIAGGDPGRRTWPTDRRRRDRRPHRPRQDEPPPRVDRDRCRPPAGRATPRDDDRRRLCPPALADGSEIDFVDVPGHDRLVGNMLVGAGEIDAALLVVAADDGPRAQTIEHLELLDALGIRHGVAVVTKRDLAGQARTAERRWPTSEPLLAPTTLAGSPVLAVSSTPVLGLDELRAALVGPARPGPRRRRTVGARRGPSGSPSIGSSRSRAAGSSSPARSEATDSSAGRPLGSSPVAAIGPGPRAPGPRARRRVRSTDGGRIALNLTGVDGAAISRGDVLTADPAVSTDRPAGRDPPATGWARRPVCRLPGVAAVARSVLRLHLGTASADATSRRGWSDAVDLRDGQRVVTLGLDGPIVAASATRSS